MTKRELIALKLASLGASFTRGMRTLFPLLGPWSTSAWMQFLCKCTTLSRYHCIVHCIVPVAVRDFARGNERFSLWGGGEGIQEFNRKFCHSSSSSHFTVSAERYGVASPGSISNTFSFTCKQWSFFGVKMTRLCISSKLALEYISLMS